MNKPSVPTGQQIEARPLFASFRCRRKFLTYILRRNCLLQQVIEGKIKGRIKVTGRQGRRRRKLLDDLNPLNAELNPICHLLAFAAAPYIYDISRLRVKERR
jgi:hypothetical protein